MKEFLVSRVELLVVIIVALCCAWYVYAVTTDSASLPTADEAKIRTEFDAIRGAAQRDPPRPLPRQPEDSLMAMRRRLGAPSPSPVLSQWLGRHPNYFESDSGGDGLFLYVYQILRPALAVDSEVGYFQLQAELPVSQETGDERIGAGGDFRRQRDLPGRDPVVNRARVVAVQIQQRQGGGSWQPVDELGSGGIMPADPGLVFNERLMQIQSGQDYEYRARVLVAATGHAPGQQDVGRAVVVYRGELKEQPDWRDFPAEFAELETTAMRSADGGVTSLAQSLPQTPATLDLEGKERLYAGPWCEPVLVEAPSDFRIGFKGVSTFGDKVSARFWMRKLLRGVDDEIIGWTPPDEQFQIEIGDPLGKPIVILDESSGRKIEVDLTTDYVLQGLEEDVERILYYKVGLERDADNSRILTYEAKTDETDIAVLSNTETGKELRLIKLDTRIRWRPNDIIYPAYPGESLYSELSELQAADPSDFQSPRAPGDLTVEEPVWHEKDDPLLWRYDELAQTDQRYLEFADGRLVYYDHINRQIFVVDTAPEDGGGQQPADGEGADGPEAVDVDRPLEAE